MHNGNGKNGNGRDRFGPARRQKKYRRRKKDNLRVLDVQIEKNILSGMIEGLMKKHGFVGGTPDEFLKCVMVSLVADWLASHWQNETSHEGASDAGSKH